MKIKNKIVAIIIISIMILFNLLIGTNYAENETGDETVGTGNNVSQESNNTQEDNQESNQVTDNATTDSNVDSTTDTPSIPAESTTTNNTQTTNVKSSNANLSDLGILPHDFTGFKYGITYYEVAVPEETETVEVYARTQDSRATLTGTGMKKLEKGENKVEVVVIAEDGTTKTYTINIIREVQQEVEEEDVEEAINIEDGNGLLELKLGDLILNPEFATDVYEYTVKYIGTDTKLNIETKPTSENYIVEIIGNEDLQEGENIITILVSDENGENVATYQITVNKSLEDYEAIAREEAAKKESQQKIIIGAVGAVILVGIIIFIIVRLRRNRNFAEDYSGVGFYNSEDEYDDYEYDEFGVNNMPSDELDYEEEYQEETRKRHKAKRFK